MPAFAPVLYALAAAAPLPLAAVAVLSRPQREALAAAVPAWVAAALLAVWALTLPVPLLVLDAVEHHAFAPHEDALHLAWQGQEAGDQSPVAVSPALVLAFSAAGRWGADLSRYVPLAMLLGGLGPLFAGLAAQIATRRPSLALGVTALLGVHPTLGYWRLHAFHAGPAHGLFALCLLLGVLARRTGTGLAHAAWFLAGAGAVSLRLELAPAVVATALLVATRESLLQPRRWLPGLLAAVAVLAGPAWFSLTGTGTPGDFGVDPGLVLPHLSVPAVWAPLHEPWFVLVLPLALLGLGWRRAGLAWWGVALAGTVPVLLFSDFGARHLLASTTAALIAVGIGLDGLAERLPRVVPAGAWAILVLGCSWASWQELADLGERYGANDPHIQPTPGGVDLPTEAMPEAWLDCAIYSDHPDLCDSHRACHPVKDLRDPRRVRQRWDEFDGCVLFAADPSLRWIIGARHERWLFISRLHRWQPYGRYTVPGLEMLVEDPGQPPRWEVTDPVHVPVYRMTHRP